MAQPSVTDDRPARLRDALRGRASALFSRGEEAPCQAAPVTFPASTTLDAFGPSSAPAAIPVEALALDRVTHRYGKVTAVDDVSLTIPTGMFGLLGPNGAGKSTLMRTIATLQSPTSARFASATST